ncbi:MAG: TonB-dependent receptor plug domain-containing protein, partial [Parasphingorhabdus sp.]
MKKANIPARNVRSLRISAVLLAGTAMVATPVFAQEAEADQSNEDVIVVSGIRGSLAKALDEKRNADSLVEVIQAEDIGKLPDQNLAEVLENVTGVQITRTAGVGTGVQIRGTNANRTEINGVG